MWSNMIWALLRVSILGFGGGPSSIPLLHKEAVEKYKWFTDEEFTNILAIGNSLPGPILTKMAGYVGYYLKGTLGAIIAILITTVPTIAAMIGLFALLGSVSGNVHVENATTAIEPVIGVMLAVMAYQMWHKNKQKLGLIISIGMTGIIAALLYFTNLHPAFLIVALLIIGALRSKPISIKKQEKGAKQ